MKPEWMQDSNPCQSYATDFFFPNEGGFYQKQAIDVCMKCPNRIRCLDYAMDNNILHGIWGGMNERARRRLAMERRRQIAV